MTVQLFIGQVAELLGVTTKTIRYYEGIGLLGQAERTESGYRLYDAQDLLRLFRIRQLQDLGLSLDRIRILVQAPDRPHVAQDILHTLEAEITVQIAELEARRQRVRDLLAQSPTDILAQPQELPPTLKLLQEYLGGAVEFATSGAIYADQLWAQLDVFLWQHAEYRQQQRELIQHIVENPETRAQITNLMARVKALAEAPAETPEVEDLADIIVWLQGHNPILASILPQNAQPSQPNVEILAQFLIGTAEAAPAQRRLFQLVAQQLAV